MPSVVTADHPPQISVINEVTRQKQQQTNYTGRVQSASNPHRPIWESLLEIIVGLFCCSLPSGSVLGEKQSRLKNLKGCNDRFINKSTGREKY